MLAALPVFAEDKEPNVVIILVDNVGYGDFGVYGGTTATPRIDELATEGIRFTNYNVEIQCKPSRSAMMTGRHPVRSGTYSVLPPPVAKTAWCLGNTQLRNCSSIPIMPPRFTANGIWATCKAACPMIRVLTSGGAFLIAGFSPALPVIQCMT